MKLKFTSPQGNVNYSESYPTLERANEALLDHMNKAPNPAGWISLGTAKLWIQTDGRKVEIVVG